MAWQQYTRQGRGSSGAQAPCHALISKIFLPNRYHPPTSETCKLWLEQCRVKIARPLLFHTTPLLCPKAVFCPGSPSAWAVSTRLWLMPWSDLSPGQAPGHLESRAYCPSELGRGAEFAAHWGPGGQLISPSAENVQSLSGLPLGDPCSYYTSTDPSWTSSQPREGSWLNQGGPCKDWVYLKVSLSRGTREACAPQRPRVSWAGGQVKQQVQNMGAGVVRCMLKGSGLVWRCQGTRLLQTVSQKPMGWAFQGIGKAARP